MDRNRFTFAVVDGLVYIGNFPDQSYLTDLMSIKSFIGAQSSIDDRSTADLRCLAAERYAFALPRGTPRVGQRFDCNGIDFRVERCDDGTCDTYEVTAVCAVFRRGHCYHAPPGQPAAAPPFYRYRVSGGEGITMIDFAPDHPGTDLTLQYGRGLFSSNPAEMR